MSTQELAYWDEQAQVEQDEALDASPDPDYDIHEETVSDADLDYDTSRGV